MELNPKHIYRGKDERRESLIQEQLESGLLSEHPDKKLEKRREQKRKRKRAQVNELK